MPTSTAEFLKKIPLFSSLPDEDLERLCEMVDEIRVSPGDLLFSEGSPGDKAYIIKEGEIEITRFSGGKNVLLAVRKAGEVIGEVALLEAVHRIATGRARTEGVLIVISQEQLEQLLNSSSSAARTLLSTMTARLRSTELMLQQSEKMAQLGTLTAGIAHELNNPAAAAKRGADQLRTGIAQLQNAQRRLQAFQLIAEQMAALQELEMKAQASAAQPLDLDSLSRSDRESDLETWLEGRGIERAWELAPLLVNLGFEHAHLENLVRSFHEPHSNGRGELLQTVIDWLGASYTVYSLLEEISQGAGRISDIVHSLKSYAYLDQAPVQLVDVNETLDNTLVMLRSKLKDGIQLQREYDPSLPRIEAYGSELNQVWTNIIVNAVDAMDGRGRLTLRTHKDSSFVVVEIEDSGPGIPEEIQSKIFNPFFTTKPVGKGTGLGLNITYNIIQKHSGEIKIYSRPGKTRFTVTLPVKLNEAQSGANPISMIPNVDDEKLRQILENTRTIAVVGIGDRKENANFSVPVYLRNNGYRILPVNPNLKEFQGQPVYPDLLAISEPVDTVLVFRRSEAVPQVVDQAIQIGAKVVWMQEGIVNETAAAKARDAGLDVVMDTCMRAAHKRLIGALAKKTTEEK
ncbi:MAG: histidine kinase [Chloroflexota bacterium]|nr:MAG: histidine kinase [Chloroflexota bacterium]